MYQLHIQAKWCGILGFMGFPSKMSFSSKNRDMIGIWGIINREKKTHDQEKDKWGEIMKPQNWFCLDVGTETFQDGGSTILWHIHSTNRSVEDVMKMRRTYDEHNVIDHMLLATVVAIDVHVYRDYFLNISNWYELGCRMPSTTTRTTRTRTRTRTTTTTTTRARATRTRTKTTTTTTTNINWNWNDTTLGFYLVAI